MRRWAAGTVALWMTLAAWAQPSGPGLAVLQKLLSRKDTAGAALLALRASGDPELAVLFEAAARRGDVQQRQFALEVLQELGAQQARDVFLWTLHNDPDPDLRCQALAYLGAMKALSAAQLVELLNSPHEDLRLLAGRQLLLSGQGEPARQMLTNLAGSNDPATAAMAQVSLLSLGQPEGLESLCRLLEDPQTDPQVVVIVLEAAAEDGQTAMSQPALRVAQRAALLPVRLSAWRTYCQLCPVPTEELAGAIRGTDQTVLRVRLMWILAGRADAQAALEGLLTDSGVTGQLARFELARLKGDGQAAQEALRALLTAAHPVVIDYVLERAKADITGRKEASGFYAQPLLDLVAGVDREARKMGPEHMRAARAATLVADLGTQEALAALARLLAGPFNAVTRTAAAGLVQTRNPSAAELARPLLGSPYEELSGDALMALGHMGDPEAAAGLQALLDRQDRHPVEMVALAGWYLLKVQGQQQAAAGALAESFR